MSLWRVFVVAAAAAFVPILCRAQTPAPDLLRASQALDLIDGFSAKMCKDVPLYTENSTTRLTARGKAELAGILKKLSNLGADISANIQHRSSIGLVQKQLANALHNEDDCKLNIFDSLKSIVFPKPSLDPSSAKKLASAYTACMTANFSEADGIYNELLIANPENETIEDAKSKCDKIASNPRNVKIGLRVSPGVFMYGQGDNAFFADFVLEIGGNDCGFLSNLRGPKSVRCDLVPGRHSFRLKHLNVYGLNNRTITAGASCGGGVKIVPTTDQYGIVICLKKPFIACAMPTADKLDAGFSYKDCHFFSNR